MPSILRRFLGILRSHPLTADIALALALLGAALVSSSVIFTDFEASDPSYVEPNQTVVAAGLAAMTLPLAFRRRFPLAALLACTAGFLLSRIVLDSVEASITAIVMSLAVYSAAAHGRPIWRNRVIGLSLVAVMGELWRELNVNVPPDVPNLLVLQGLELLVNLALFSAMWALGTALGAGRRRAAELTARTEELEREREESARRAAFDERVRIARELHDVVAHHVSTMGVQAGAARVVLSKDPERARESLSAIEASSRQAVLELHRLLGFLRQEDETDELAPRPGLGEVRALAAGVSDSELIVEVHTEGSERPLPPTVDVSAYRIVQEALTNTRKHSGASHADVVLRYRPDELELEIVDDGRGTPATVVGRGGLGITGMRERAALHGGRLTAGVDAGGGFAVRATLPTSGGSE